MRYPRDLTDEEWALVEPLIPPAKRGGNKRTVNVREVVDGLMLEGHMQGWKKADMLLEKVSGSQNGLQKSGSMSRRTRI